MLLAGLLSSAATAQERSDSADIHRFEQRLEDRGPYLHLFGSTSFGRGFRLNNPYRLATPLGDDAESLSLSATYLDLAAGAALGDADGFSHAALVHLAFALDGIRQEVLTPSYALMHRLPPRVLLYGRAGVPLVLEPDFTGGLELAAGGVYYLSGGVGLTGELIGSLFYGAATLETATTLIPIVSLQLGVWLSYEVLP